MKFLILAACVAVATAFTPAAKPVCNADNNEGGSLLLSHENYCQLFYSCNGDQQAFEMTCPDGYLFSWDQGLANCVPPDSVTVTCPNWRCLSSDIGNRFPDTCCSKYWECTSGGRYQQRSCPVGQTFNSVTENCDFNTCTSNSYCIDNIRPSSETHCHDVAEANSPCTYSTVWAGVTT
ncbi:uncharacterized protein LOC106011722, partial [Aplysia californica]|uniref:Uncharacterized protein LOC106011722 n=1 Tax=Aplysia californica TaxID=6500 RepID=A0ABM0ZZJ7_APLCA